jgi:hypothetical protein
MYKIIDENGAKYDMYHYPNENEYERMVVKNIDSILGSQGIYFDVKKRIGKPKQGAAIPDGYYLDLMFHKDPTLYFVEVELKTHDLYGHIGEQILRFSISSESDKHKIKKIIIEDLNTDENKKRKLNNYFEQSRYKHISELLDVVIFDNPVSAIVIIDESSDELSRVLSHLRIPTEVIEVQTYCCGLKKLHRFTPFKDEILEDLPPTIDLDELDTIVVPSREDGFERVFLKEERWYAIRISGAMLNKIKHIAAYQVAPVSAITHVAEVDRIEKYGDSDKYIVYFKPGTLKEIKKIRSPGGKGSAPQAPRYTTHYKLETASTLSDLWE